MKTKEAKIITMKRRLTKYKQDYGFEVERATWFGNNDDEARTILMKIKILKSDIRSMYTMET